MPTAPLPVRLLAAAALALLPGAYAAADEVELPAGPPPADAALVTPGEAELWTTVLGTTAQPYTIQVERVTMTGSDPNRNLLIRVTDKRLLDATGGVVQGMSGSPIVQNGRLAAVLTHVLVNDPSRGYAIFATTMLEKADAVASSK